MSEGALQPGESCAPNDYAGCSSQLTAIFRLNYPGCFVRGPAIKRQKRLVAVSAYRLALTLS